MRIVILGGYGNFGARICRGLARDPALMIIATGRHPASAPADFANQRIQTAALDIGHPDWVSTLRELSPAIVIHCIGPFQNQSYDIARSVLACGAHYIDLADGRDFVAGFAPALNEDAMRANRIAVTGASTLPALSSAVVDTFAGGFSRLDGIETVIAPGQHAPRGAATLAAVFSYIGRPFDVWQEGRWQKMFGWMHVQKVGLGPIGKRLSAVCDVPDLALFPVRYPGLQTARFRAALEVGFQHVGLACLAALCRVGIALPIAKLAPLMERTARFFDTFGSGTGGMTVTLSGLGHNGQARVFRWHVIAPDNHGPEIPCMPAILLARKLAAGQVLEVGAMPCMGLIPLNEFEPEFAHWGMRADTEELR